jgi:hypothetical protein
VVGERVGKFSVERVCVERESAHLILLMFQLINEMRLCVQYTI